MATQIDEADYERVMGLAARAEQWLAEEDFRTIIAYLKDCSIVAWVNTTRMQTEEREKLWHDVQAISRLEEALKGLKELRKREIGNHERVQRIAEWRAKRRNAGYG
jgi:hypothetical protein